MFAPIDMKAKALNEWRAMRRKEKALADPRKLLSVRSRMSPEEYDRIARASLLNTGGTFVTLSSMMSAVDAQKRQSSAQTTTSASSAHNPSPSKSHRKRPAHKSPSARRLTLQSDVTKIINHSRAEDVDAWKGMGNERSSREWAGNGKQKSPQSTPHPANIPPVRRTRVRTSTPNAMPKPLTNPPPNNKKGSKGAAAAKSHAANTSAGNGHPNTTDAGTSLARQSSQDSIGPGEETLTSAPMTRKRSSGGGGSAIPTGLMHENGSGKQIIPPSPLRESSVAVMATLVEEEAGQEVESGAGTGVSTSAGKQIGKKRKRPWEIVIENGEASHEDAIPAKIRRGSEPFTTGKKAKELISGAGEQSFAVPTISTFATPGKRAATLSPPPSPSTLVFSEEATVTRGAIRPAHRARTSSRRATLPDDFTGTDVSTAITEDGNSASENDSSSINNDDGSAGSTDAGPPDPSQTSSSSYPPPFLSTRIASGGGSGPATAPSLKRIASTDSYGSSSGGGGAGRTRRETAIPKALRDYEMKIKV